MALVYPVYVIRPFRHQAPRELAIALQTMRYRPAIEAVCLIVVFASLLYSWKFLGRKLCRTSAVACAFLVLACGLLSRINIYEQMFHPAEQSAFAPVRDSKLAANEQVIAISLAATARAYPVRIISYHHIINDTLAGKPVVATY